MPSTMSAVGQTSPSTRRHTPALGVPAYPSPVPLHPRRDEADARPEPFGAPARLALTRRAHQVMRRHMLRAVVRVSVLILGDAGALLLLRALMRGVRDLGWLGGGVASVVNNLIPPGALPVVQLLPAVLLGLIVLDTYGASDRRRDAGRLVAGTSFGLALPFWGYLWNDFSALAFPGFIVLALSISLTLIVVRQAIDRTVRKLWPVGAGAARALVIGRQEDTGRAMDHPLLTDQREFTITGVFDPADLHRGAGRRNGLGSLYQTIKRQRADTLVLAGPLGDDTFGAVIEAAGAAGCQLFALTRAFAVGGVEPQVVWRRGAPLVALNRPSLRGRQLIMKRTLDLVCSAVGLLLAPLFALIALVIRLSSPGPVFFKQTRVGLGGRSFRITKFRTMVPDAEARKQDLVERSLYADQRLFKMVDDPRVTPIGAFLRRTSLDELPQLWNVLCGDMSLVGPRPPLPSEVDLYEEHHYSRFDVKPGITGPWQVSGRNSITDFEEVIRLETEYIREWTIWKDIGILLRTVPVVVYMQGAAWVATFDQDSRAPAGLVEALLAAWRSHPARERVGLLAPVHREQESGRLHAAPSGGMPSEVPTTMMSGNLVSAAAFAAVGWYEEPFFIDYVDHEFCLRLGRAGFRILEVPGAVLEHNLGRMTSRRVLGREFATTNHSALRRYYNARNRLWVWRRHAARRPGWALGDMRSFVVEVVKIALLEEQRGAKLAAVARGLLHGLGPQPAAAPPTSRP
jgi:exopolysaccharide biosynthesis polyprenyl glycosylphosphotransferase